MFRGQAAYSGSTHTLHPSIHRAISGQSEQRTINSKFEYCQLTQLKYCEFVRQSTIENDALRLLLRSPTQSMMELETKRWLYRERIFQHPTGGPQTGFPSKTMFVTS